MAEQSIFERNLEALRENNPGLARELRGVTSGGVELVEARNSEYTFKYRGIYFHSRYDPVKEALVQFEGITETEADWVVLFGLGCGYLFKTFVQGRQGRAQGAKVVVFEPSMDILVGVLRKLDLSRFFIKKNVYIYTRLGLVEDMVSTQIECVENILRYETIAYKQVFFRELEELIAGVEKARNVSRAYVKKDIDSRLVFLENYFANIDNFFKYPDVSSLLNKFKGVPMIVVGSGPSLEKNVELLKGVKGKAVIIAAVSALMPLIHFGITPDLVICGEQVKLDGHFTGAEEESRTRFIFADVVHPSMFDRRSKGKYVYISNFMWLSLQHARFWGNKYCPEFGGSVTTTALGLGVDLGCDPVVMIGQDLAFGDNSTHAKGAAYSDQSLHFEEDGTVKIQERYANSEEVFELEHEVLWLDGVNGRRLPSKSDWVTFHSWFVEYMRKHHEAENPTRVINATEGGAHIEGMEHARLKDVIERFITRDYPIEDILNKADKEREKADLDGLRSAYDGIFHSLDHVRTMAQSIVKDAEEVMEIFNSSGVTREVSELVARIQKDEKRLFDESVDVVFMWETVVEYTYELRKYIRADADDGLLDLVRKDLESIITTYSKIGEAAGRFIPIVKDAIKSVEKKQGRNVDNNRRVRWTKTTKIHC